MDEYFVFTKCCDCESVKANKRLVNTTIKRQSLVKCLSLSTQHRRTFFFEKIVNYNVKNISSVELNDGINIPILMQFIHFYVNTESILFESILCFNEGLSDGSFTTSSDQNILFYIFFYRFSGRATILCFCKNVINRLTFLCPPKFFFRGRIQDTEFQAKWNLLKRNYFQNIYWASKEFSLMNYCYLDKQLLQRSINVSNWFVWRSSWKEILYLLEEKLSGDFNSGQRLSWSRKYNKANDYGNGNGNSSTFVFFRHVLFCRSL